MAATSLTIARQIQNWRSENFTPNMLDCMLGAPGWDCILGVENDHYGELYSVCRVVIAKDAPASAEQIETIKDAARKCEQDSLFLQGYGLLTYEQFVKHRKEFVKFGRSYWNRRYEQYHRGELKAALRAADPENVQKAMGLGNAA